MAALWGEFCTRLISYNWSQPFAGSVMGRDPVGKSDGTPILLVHGYFSNRGMWVRFRERLVRDGFGPIYTIDLGPPFGGIDHFAAQLAKRIEDVCTETGASQITVVAHSMGGLVTRSYMAERAAQGLPPRIHLLITLGSPHHGTQLAAFGLGRAVQQMREKSVWLEGLVRQENASTARPETVSIFTRNDDLIYPPESSELAWAENIAVDGVGHVGLLYSEPVFQIVKEQLTSKGGRFEPEMPENARQ
jgi:triacylglycerol esterase/lipase EstA (alpha/beta hydrolase family)